MIWQHNHAKNQLQNQALSQAHLYNKESSAQRPVKVKKMNANKYFEEMQKQKEAEERERLEEQRYLPEFPDIANTILKLTGPCLTSLR